MSSTAVHFVSHKFGEKIYQVLRILVHVSYHQTLHCPLVLEVEEGGAQTARQRALGMRTEQLQSPYRSLWLLLRKFEGKHDIKLL